MNEEYNWETDFLLAYETMPNEAKQDLLKRFLPHEGERVALLGILANGQLRARFELEFNEAVPFEDFQILNSNDYARVAGVFRGDHGPHTMATFQTITPTKRHLETHMDVPGLYDPYRFFAPLIDAYLCRDRGIGVVATKPFVNMALALGDIGLLSAIVDPLTGLRAFPGAWAEVKEKGWPLLNGAAVRKKRAIALRLAPYQRSGVEVHDLSYNRPPADLLPRQLAFDLHLFTDAISSVS